MFCYSYGITLVLLIMILPIAKIQINEDNGGVNVNQSLKVGQNNRRRF